MEVAVWLTQTEVDDINNYMIEKAGQTGDLGISSLMYRLLLEEIHR